MTIEERTYTPKANRSLFFARYEATRSGNVEVEPEHLILGLIRADAELLRRLSGLSPDPDSYIRAAIEVGTAFEVKFTVGELPPLSRSAQQALDSAFIQSQNLNHAYIGTEHILLGLLAQNSIVSQILRKLGFTLEGIIPKIAGGSLTDQHQQGTNQALLEGWIVPTD